VADNEVVGTVGGADLTDGKVIRGHIDYVVE